VLPFIAILTLDIQVLIFVPQVATILPSIVGRLIPDLRSRWRAPRSGPLASPGIG
jgi:hypothetical protein